MPLLDDYPLEPERDTLPSSRRTGRDWRIGGAVLLVVVAALIAFFVVRPSPGPGVGDTDATPPAAQGNAPQARGPLGPAVEPRDLPPLERSDPLVRELLSALSSRPELATWLATDGLIRSFVAGVDAVANGGTPVAHARRLAPTRPFAAVPRGDGFAIDARSYQRYDGIADMVAGLDADGLARAYSTLRPRLQEAYRELGYPDANFDAAVERAIGHLLATPLLEREPVVQPAPVLYQFADPRLERLSAAQKQLLRLGPRNQRLIQDKLREIARALGITAS